MWDAFGKGRSATIANLMSNDPSARLILSSDDDWYGHADRIPELLVARASTMGVERVEYERFEAFEFGDTGWCATELTVFYVGGSSNRFRQTATFILEDGMWRWTQVHTSAGVAATETFGYDVAAGLEALVGSLTESESGDLAAAAGASGLVTLMFTDIEDSTFLSHQRGEAAWIAAVQAHFDEIEHATKAAGGTVVKTLGDGAMAAFPTARGAVDAAITIQGSDRDPEMRIRIGIHTGEALAVGADYAGVAVAKAARVASAADGGETLLSAATKELVARFDYAMGEERVAELKGIPGTHRLTPLAR